MPRSRRLLEPVLIDSAQHLEELVLVALASGELVTG